ncbi:PhzF family phenazine biosynthesis protein [Agarivorans sp. OAG1]|uniref:PhzF family phenazine biosynthesis protein n=1 Tax=Agarivorans sp. OAG1 TaxID=3082387 RepID=UPI0030D5CF67
MIEVTVSVVHAFTKKTDGGNPAAVIELDSWLSDISLQKLASTQPAPVSVFVVAIESHFEIRWFTQETEINLCGHGTIAAAGVLLHAYSKGVVHFTSKYGCPVVKKSHGKLSLLFPQWAIQKQNHSFIQCSMNRLTPSEVYASRDLILVFESEQQVVEFQPDLDFIASLEWHAVIATAPGNNSDYVLRYFVPKVGIDEDAATGSAQCSLAPFWARKLEKSEMVVYQLSKQGGEFKVELTADSINITASAQLRSQYCVQLEAI